MAVFGGIPLKNKWMKLHFKDCKNHLENHNIQNHNENSVVENHETASSNTSEASSDSGMSACNSPSHHLIRSCSSSIDKSSTNYFHSHLLSTSHSDRDSATSFQSTIRDDDEEGTERSKLDIALSSIVEHAHIMHAKEKNYDDGGGIVNYFVDLSPVGAVSRNHNTNKIIHVMSFEPVSKTFCSPAGKDRHDNLSLTGSTSSESSWLTYSSTEFTSSTNYLSSSFSQSPSTCNYSSHHSSSHSTVALSSSTTSTSSNGRPIDQECRSKMLEWSLQLLDRSFPPPRLPLSPLTSYSNGFPKGRNGRRNYRRRHSSQTIQLVYQTFHFVDRYCSKCCRRRDDSIRTSRTSYKLLCMVCLHLACKTSGLFGYEGEQSWSLYDIVVVATDDDPVATGANTAAATKEYSANNHSCCRVICGDDECWMDHHRDHSIDSSSCGGGMAHKQIDDNEEEHEKEAKNIPINRSSDNNPATPRQQHHEDAKSIHHPVTIHSTISTKRTPSCGHPDDDNNDELYMSKDNSPRPMLNLLSMEGLIFLCRNEFTVRELTDMEVDVLFGLDWKIACNSTPLDWLDLFITFGETIGWNISYGGGHGYQYLSLQETHYWWKEVYELSLVQLDEALRSSQFMLIPPLVTSLAAFLNSMEEMMLYSLHLDYRHYHYFDCDMRSRVGGNDDGFSILEEEDNDFFPKETCKSNSDSVQNGVMNGNCEIVFHEGGFPTMHDYLQRIQLWMDIDFDEDELRVVRGVLQNFLHCSD